MGIFPGYGDLHLPQEEFTGCRPCDLPHVHDIALMAAEEDAGRKLGGEVIDLPVGLESFSAFQMEMDLVLLADQVQQLGKRDGIKVIVEGEADGLAGIPVKGFRRTMEDGGKLLRCQGLDQVVEGKEIIGFPIEAIAAAHKDDGGAGIYLPDPPGCLHSADAAHEDIQKEDVKGAPILQVHKQSFPAGIGLAFAGKIFLLYQGNQPLSVCLGIIAYGNAQYHGVLLLCLPLSLATSVIYAV